jgi:hypothetical protein
LKPKGGNTLVLTDETFLEVAKKMPPEEFQTGVLGILKRFIAASSTTINPHPGSLSFVSSRASTALKCNGRHGKSAMFARTEWKLSSLTEGRTCDTRPVAPNRRNSLKTTATAICASASSR